MKKRKTNCIIKWTARISYALVFIFVLLTFLNNSPEPQYYFESVGDTIYGGIAAIFLAVGVLFTGVGTEVKLTEDGKKVDTIQNQVDSIAKKVIDLEEFYHSHIDNELDKAQRLIEERDSIQRDYNKLRQEFDDLKNVKNNGLKDDK